MGRTIEFEGLGTINIIPINIKDKEYENCDLEGKPLNWVKGTSTRGHYTNSEGLEIPTSQVYKKIEIDEETIIQPKMSATSEVTTDEIEIIEDNSAIYKAIERSVYKVFTESKNIKKLILEEKKTLRFPFIAGQGFKLQEGYLTDWKGELILCGVRGDFDEILKNFKDDIVDIELEIIPQQSPQMKRKLLQVLAR